MPKTQPLNKQLRSKIIDAPTAAYFAAHGVGPNIVSRASIGDPAALFIIMGMVPHTSMITRATDGDWIDPQPSKYRVQRATAKSEGPIHFSFETMKEKLMFQISEDDGVGAIGWLSVEKYSELVVAIKNKKLVIDLCLNDVFYHVEDELRVRWHDGFDIKQR